jgi:glucosamine-6-phosphate deaminase
MNLDQAYRLTLEDFRRLRPAWEFLAFPNRQAQDAFFALDLLDRLVRDAAAGKQTVAVLPVGPIDYSVLVSLANARNTSLANLVAVFMDEYCDAGGGYVPLDHPLSFRGFVQRTLVAPLKPELRIPPEQVIFPDGRDPAATVRAIAGYGGVDVTYGGFGITGHLAFNDPPDDPSERTESRVRHSTVRVVELSRETLVQNAMGGTGGNLDLIPRHAVTLGMAEMLAAREMHLYLLRTWHAGIARKALFGPVSPECPGSYVQEHGRVRVCLTPEALALPAVNVTLNIGA